MGKITANDRLIFTLLFSIIIHVAIVLGVTFTATPPPAAKPPISLDITLAKKQTDLAPEEADYLAQVNNEGGGITDEKSPDPSDAKVNKKSSQQIETQELALAQPIKAPPSIEPQLDIPVEAAPEETTEVSQPDEMAQPKASPSEILTQQKAKRKVEKITEQAEKKQEELTEPQPQPTTKKLILPSQKEIAQLEKNFDDMSKALSKKPTKRKISVATKQYAAAAYMSGWESKVERIGNFNYPLEAKRQGLNGSLMLTVDINPDGSVPPDGIVISRSSGHKLLDDAAVRIVRLGAPYAAIPKDVLDGNDMLTIIRTWKFETNLGLSKN